MNDKSKSSKEDSTDVSISRANEVKCSAIKTEDTLGNVPYESDDNDESSEDENHAENEALTETVEATWKAPDGGWGWMVLFGCLMIHTITGGFDGVSGIFYVKFSEIFGRSASRTASVMSLPPTVRLLTGPFVSLLCNKFSCRSLAMFGSGLFALAIHISAYANSLEYLFFSYSLLGGLGRSFILNPLPILLGKYFDKRRSLAFGISSAGFGLGSTVITPVVEFIFQKYGFKRTFFVLGITACHLFIFAWLLRPLPKTDSHPIKTKKTVNDAIENTAGNPQGTKNNLSTEKLDKEIDNRPRTINKLLSCTALKNVRFFTLCISTLLFALTSNRLFIPALAKSRGISDIQAAYLLSIVAGSDLLSRLIAGCVFDLKSVRDLRPFVYNFMSFLKSLALFLFPFLHTFEQFTAVCILLGVVVGTKAAQKEVIVVDILGVEKLPNSFAILLVFQGVGTLVGPPVSGFLKDVYGTYDCSFYFGGTCALLSAFILLGGNVRNCIDKSTDT